MIYKEKEKNGFEQRLKRYPVEQQIKIKKRRKIVLFSVLCLSVLFALFYPSIALFGYNDAKEYIKHNFISCAELEKMEIYLNQSSDYFTAKAEELKSSDPNIYEIYFHFANYDNSVQTELRDDNEKLLNRLDINIPDDVVSALREVTSDYVAIIVYKNEIQFDHWDIERGGGYCLCRSLNNSMPTEKCKDGLYFYVKDGWWNHKHWHTLWRVLF